MASRRASSFDDKRARIAALACSPKAIAAAELRRYLGDKNGYLCGQAAGVAQELDLRELVPEMAAAFDRFLVDGAATDKGCFGKKHILEALLAFEADVPSVYLAGVRCVQLEPAFGEPVDAAVPVRTLSAHALVQIDHPAALVEIAPLLADPEPLVRAEAARALGRSGLEPASALLHLKALTGDAEPDVVEACYEGLLRLAPRRHLAFVAAALRDESRAEAAALALGESRLREALPLLREALSGAAAPRERQSVIMAIALLRSDEATALLLTLVEGAAEAHAVVALDALALHRHDAAVAERVRSAVAARGSRRLAEALRDRFGPPSPS